MKWGANGENEVIFVGKENEKGQVITSAWVKPTSFSPECLYSKEDEGKLKITMSVSNENLKKEPIMKMTLTQKPNHSENTTPAFPEKLTTAHSSKTVMTEVYMPPLDTKSGFTNRANAKREPATETCFNDADTVQDLANTAFEVPAIALKRWREYEIVIIVENVKTGKSIEKTFQYNTFRWQCPGTCQTIGQLQLCDGTEDCPGGTDESKKNCEVSQLPTKAAYGLYGYMMLLITIYLMFMTSPKPVVPRTEELELINEERLFDSELYKDQHRYDNLSLSSKIKQQTYNKLFDVDDEQVNEICEQVRAAEVEEHKDPEEVYNCILKHFGGDHPITARLVDPSGGLMLKAKKLINQKLNSKTRWFALRLNSMFIFLCLHHFDYIKDIGEIYV